MGYIPPPPGAFAILEPGCDFIEVTCLEDAHPRYVERYPTGRKRDWYEAEAQYSEHRKAVRAMDAETLRQARIGAALLLAMAVDVIAMVAGF